MVKPHERYLMRGTVRGTVRVTKRVYNHDRKHEGSLKPHERNHEGNTMRGTMHGTMKGTMGSQKELFDQSPTEASMREGTTMILGDMSHQGNYEGIMTKGSNISFGFSENHESWHDFFDLLKTNICIRRNAKMP